MQTLANPSGAQPPVQYQAQVDADSNARATKEAWPPSHERALLPIEAQFKARFKADSTARASDKTAMPNQVVRDL
jgi:hypothetical protein